MKVIVKDHQIIEKELDIDYPFFLYFQSELGEDELVKVFPDYTISVFFTLFGAEIKQKKHYGYSENQVINNLTTQEIFDNAFEEALQHLVELKSGL